MLKQLERSLTEKSRFSLPEHSSASSLFTGGSIVRQSKMKLTRVDCNCGRTLAFLKEICSMKLQKCVV